VTIDLSAIGGPPAREMVSSYNDFYSSSTFIESTIPLGLKALTVTVTDANGDTARSDLGLQVVGEFSGTLSSSICREYDVIIDTEGQNLNISAEALFPEIYSVPLTVQIFLPSNQTNNPDYTLELAGEGSYLEIPSVPKGTLSIVVCFDIEYSAKLSTAALKQADEAQFSISVSTTGTGIIFGNVIDAETGAPLSGVSITTSGGSSTETDNGYYRLIVPAGVYNVTASDPAYKDKTMSVDVQSGVLVGADMLLEPKDFDRGTEDGGEGGCPVAQSFESKSRVLPLLRSFRDTSLSKSAQGRRLIKKYYRFAPEAAVFVKKDPELMGAVRKTVLQILPLIEKVLANKPAELSAPQRAAITNCLEKLKKVASPALKREIDRFIGSLGDNQGFNDLLAQ